MSTLKEWNGQALGELGRGVSATEAAASLTKLADEWPKCEQLP